MTILTPRANSLAAFDTARMQLLAYVFGGLGIVAAILAMPKDFAWDELRLVLAGLFFAALMTAVWSAADPLKLFLRAWIQVTLEDFGQESRAIGYDWVGAVYRYLASFVWLITLVLGLLFLRILAAWPIGSMLLPFMQIVHIAFWLTLCAIPVQLFVSTNQVAEIVTLWRVFQQQIEGSGFQRRSIATARARADALTGPAVIVRGPYQFAVGGIDWSWDDFLTSAMVMGETGSGKTVTVLNALLDGLLSSANGQDGTLPASALILDPKGDYRAKISRLCARLGRSSDLIIFDPGASTAVRWNPFDSPDDALEISERFAGVLELLGMKNEKDTFFLDSAKALLRHAVAFLRISKPADQPPSFADINEIAADPIKLEARLFILHAKALLRATGADKVSPVDLRSLDTISELMGFLQESDLEHDAIVDFFATWRTRRAEVRERVLSEVERLLPLVNFPQGIVLRHGSEGRAAVQFMLREWIMNPADRTRAGVLGHLSNMISPFLTDPYLTAFSGRSTFNLKALLDTGKILYVYMPIADKSRMSQVGNTLIKLDFYRQVLLQLRKSRKSLFLCDEFQTFLTADASRGDAQFFSRARESGHANVVATQNISGLLTVVDKPEIVDSLLGNCAVKMFLRNTEVKTQEYVSKYVFGEYMSRVVTVGRGTGAQGGFVGFGTSANIQVSDQKLPRVAPERLAHLAKPDPAAGVLFSEVLVRLGSRPQVQFERLLCKVHPLE